MYILSKRIFVKQLTELKLQLALRVVFCARAAFSLSGTLGPFLYRLHHNHKKLFNGKDRGERSASNRTLHGRCSSLSHVE